MADAARDDAAAPLRLLLLEDRPADAELVLRELRRAGIEPDWSRVDGEREYVAALETEPQLIIADYHLPQFDAPRALELLQARGLDIPLIVVSGTVGDERAAQCIKLGAADYLLKDRLGRLARAVEQALEAKRLRRRRRAAEDALRESEERFRSAFEDSAIGMALQGLDGRYIRVNRALCQALGYSADELLAGSFHAVTHPEDQDVDVEHDRRMLAGELSSYQTEKRYRHKEGRVVWALASVSLVRHRDGHPLYFVVQVQDVTERQRAEEAQVRLQGQLVQSEKLAAMGSLLAGVAHELNNPLSVVLGQAALLRQSIPEGGPLAMRAERIAQSAERCARIVRNFLALARERPPERQHVSLNEVVESGVDLLSYGLRVDDVQLEFRLSRDLPGLWADPHQIHQVIVNLVTNAHHALRTTGRPRRVVITTRLDAERTGALLEVQDNGPGVTPEIQSRMFEPFFTTKPPGQGTGLGLSLCQGIVEGHGGAITCESEPGRGAVFRVRLPITARPPSPPDVAPAPRAEDRGKTMLVVDDEPDVAAVLADMLAEEGHQVETATSGAVALARLAERRYDLVWTDLKMPGLDGAGFFRAAQTRDPDLARRFVFLTGDGLTPETRQFLEQSRRPSLSKPFAPADVRRVLQRALGP
ncbi:MAG: hybrid sensor histidine kinase/response regulator [Candidatus Rokuibacteriota bacterium]